MSMKASFVSEFNTILKQPDTKPQSFKQERKSRENSKQGHMNPLKMKTSFLRQSLTINPSEQNLSLNSSTNNLHRNITPTQPLVLQSDRREDFMMRKIVERFSNNNNSPKNMVYQEHVVHEFPQRERDIIKLSGRRNQGMGMSQMQRNYHQQQKENGAHSLMSHSGIFTKPQHPHLPQPIFPTQDKIYRPSQQTTLSQSQTTVFDSSLAEYSSHLHNDQTSILKQQLQLILKRLAKNQCDIQALKRDKSIDIQMEGVWKQFSICENRLDGIDNRVGKVEERMGRGLQEIQELKEDVNNVKEVKVECEQSINVIESKLLSELHRLDQRLSHFTTINEQSQKINDFSKSIKTELQTTLQRLNSLLESKIQTRFAQLKWQIKSESKIKENEENHLSKICPKIGSKFTTSTKKAHQCIAIVYKQLIRAHSHQELYPVSDRTKLLAGVFNHHQGARKTTFSSPLSSQQQLTVSIPYYTPGKIEPQHSPPEIEINQVQYFIDSEGYLLDENMFYIVDEMGGQIRIDAGMVDVLRKHHMLKG